MIEGSTTVDQPNHRHVMHTGKTRIRMQARYKLKQNQVTDVRHDTRVRLALITADIVLVQFNGPILQFSLDNPAYRKPIPSYHWVRTD